MSTWQIEHTPAAGGGSTTYALAALNASSLSIQFANWADDSASLTVRSGTAAFDASAFAYRDKIVIWRDGARFFHGWCTGLGLAAQPAESRTYTFSGPSWWLAQLPFVWPYWPVKEELEATERRSWRWIQFALEAAIDEDAPIAKSPAGYASFTIPTPDLRASGNCLEVIQRVARLHPMSAGWWDYSGETPAFCASTRAGLSAQSLAISGSVETYGFAPRPDLQLESVKISYAYPDAWGGTSTVDDTAGTSPHGFGPNKLHCTIAVDSLDAAHEAQDFGIAETIHDGLSSLAWEGVVNMHEAGSALPVIRPGHRLSITGGRAEWATMSTCVQSTQWVVSAATNDICSITLGAPDHLGPQDYLELARASTISGGSGAGNPSPWDPPAPPTDDTQPGTIDDLNATGGAAPVGMIAIQSLGGTWSLGGFAAFDGSQPTRRWLTRSGSGAMTTAGNSGSPDYLTCSWIYTLSGANHYNASTLAGSGIISRSASCVGPGAGVGGYCVSSPVSPATASCGYAGALPFLGTQQVVTATTLTRTNAEGSGWYGSHTIALSAPDTEDNAWTRMVASAEWSASPATAIRTIPETGITGIRRKLRWGTYSGDTYTPLTGLVAWQRYRCHATVQRRPVNESGSATGSWADAGEVVSPFFTATLAGAGGWEWAEVLEPEAGYESQLTSITIVAE